MNQEKQDNDTFGVKEIWQEVEQTKLVLF